MATLTTIQFGREDKYYEVKIDFDDENIVEDLLTFDVTAIVMERDKKPYSISLLVELDLNETTGRILLEGEELHRFSFGALRVDYNPETHEEIIPGLEEDGVLSDPVYDNIQRGIGERIGNLIDEIPAFDPFIGCLIKSSISSLVGQAITCYELRGDYANGSRFRQVMRCLRSHVKGIAYRTLWRAARCMIRLGF